MSFQDDQRAEILSITEQMSFEYFRDLDPGPGTVGPAGTDELSACPPSQSGGRVGGRVARSLSLTEAPARVHAACSWGLGRRPFLSLFFFFIEVTLVHNSI